MTDFEMWQQSQCELLGLTTEEHNKVLKVTRNLDVAYGMGGSYDYVVNLIKPNLLKKLADTAKAMAKISNQGKVEGD